jgi:NAD(P)-dependent dehydrogenase (short-subunit alcohol dehydrogenase family)
MTGDMTRHRGRARAGGEDAPAVLITGCSSGIGRAIALAALRAGLPTWATARRPEILADLAAAGCRILRLDVTDEESRVEAVRTVEEVHGAVGALVNNAGYSQIGPVEELPLAEVRRQFETNVFGLMRMCQLVLPGMRARHQGTIVNLGSAAGLVVPPASAAYSMTKYALEALCDALRLEVGHLGVRVVLIEPGAVRSDFMATGWATMPASGAEGEPYATYKANLAAMVERTHRPGARGILDADVVARTVVKAITSRRPRPRYPIGSQARVAPVVRRIAGDRLWDRMMNAVVSADSPPS